MEKYWSLTSRHVLRVFQDSGYLDRFDLITGKPVQFEDLFAL